MMRNRNRFYQHSFIFFIAVVCVALALSGCEPLRKKFTRKSKKERADSSAESQPILAPEDYPEKPFDPLKEYKYRYSMWNVWYKDYLMAAEDGVSDKRQVYILNQMIAQLEEMEKNLTEDKRKELSQVEEKLQRTVQNFKTPGPMRNSFTTKDEVSAVDKDIRNRFNPAGIEKSLK